MNIFSRLIDSMRVNSDEDEDDYDEDEMYDDPKPRRFGLTRREEEEAEEKPRFFSRKVTPVRRSSGLEVTLVKPSVFEDAKEIVDNLLLGKAVVLNMEGINTEVAQRIIDFASGATYSMNGRLHKISSYIFIISPESVNVTGVEELLNTTSSLDISGLNMRV
ncbi:MAG: cell division protein SepF [Stomatobaculum sp.]